MARAFVLARVWLGLVPPFPAEQFDEIDDASLPVALDAFVRSQGQDVRAEIARARERWVEEERRRPSDAVWSVEVVSGPGSVSHYLDLDRTPPSLREVATCLRWARFMPQSPTDWLKPPRWRAICSVESTSRAEHVVQALRHRVEFRSASFRLRVAEYDARSTGEAAARDLEIEDLDQEIASVRVLSFQRAGVETPIHDLRAAALRVLAVVPAASPPVSDTAASNVGAESSPALSAVQARALASYQFAISQRPDLSDTPGRHYGEAYKTLRAAVEAGTCSLYDAESPLPSLESWTRHASAGLNRDRPKDVGPRATREHGSSIADVGDLSRSDSNRISDARSGPFPADPVAFRSDPTHPVPV